MTNLFLISYTHVSLISIICFIFSVLIDFITNFWFIIVVENNRFLWIASTVYEMA